MSACVALAGYVIVPLLATAVVAVPGHPAKATTSTRAIPTALTKAPGIPHANKAPNATSPTATPQPANADTSGGIPRFLEDLLITVAVAATLVFAMEPFLALAQRRRWQRLRSRAGWLPLRRAKSTNRDPVEYAKARIVLADHERLIVTYTAHDDTVYVLTPPGEDPRAVLHAARLVLPEDTYEDLADHLGVPWGES